MGIVKLCDLQLICWISQCHSQSNVVCHLAKVISSMCRERIQNFEIQAVSRLQDQCEKEWWGYIISLDCITSNSIEQIDWWWEIQNLKQGSLMVSRAQMGQSKSLALLSFTSSWPLKCLVLISGATPVPLLKWVFSNPVDIKGLHCLVLQNMEGVLSSCFCPPFLKVSSSFPVSQVTALWEEITRSLRQSKFPFPIRLSWNPV